MKRIKGSASLLIIAVLIVIFVYVVMSQLVLNENSGERAKHVSLIVYGDDSERWENLRQGAELVCKDKNADLRIMTMLSENDVAEQEDIIDREIEDGADALIIAACNSDMIRDFITQKNLGIPVIFVESMLSEGDGLKYIAPDDYNMGFELGEHILKNESDIVTVAVISENTGRDSVKLREQGLRDAIDGKVGRIINWRRNEYEKEAKTRMFIQRALVSEATDVIVTFDNTATDALLDALANLNHQSKVYSVSTSNKSVYALNNGDVKALDYSNEFSMGYLAAMHALDESYAKKKYSKEAVDHRIVRKENMYDEDNQRLLFPFVN